MKKKRLITAKEFLVDLGKILDDLSDPSTQLAFVDNMNKFKSILDKKSCFDWLETYFAWNEIGFRDDFELYYPYFEFEEDYEHQKYVDNLMMGGE
ncbi:MAG: hypothetical protein H8D23_29775 [Candidatus Brocadiales bacterium]|nr:hypothetical protein [Candidatus Brocadiales bacterium]